MCWAQIILKKHSYKQPLHEKAKVATFTICRYIYFILQTVARFEKLVPWTANDTGPRSKYESA